MVDSSSSISVTIQNYTISIGTCFSQWLSLSPPKIFIFPPESPCRQACITFIIVLFWILQFDFYACLNSLRIGQSVYKPTCPYWHPYDATEPIPNSQILIPVHLYFPSFFTMLDVSRIDTMKFYVPIPIHPFYFAALKHTVKMTTMQLLLLEARYVFHVFRTVHCNMIIQYRPMKCIFYKLMY